MQKQIIFSLFLLGASANIWSQQNIHEQVKPSEIKKSNVPSLKNLILYTITGKTICTWDRDVTPFARCMVAYRSTDAYYTPETPWMYGLISYLPIHCGSGQWGYSMQGVIEPEADSMVTVLTQENLNRANLFMRFTTKQEMATIHQQLTSHTAILEDAKTDYLYGIPKDKQEKCWQLRAWKNI